MQIISFDTFDELIESLDNDREIADSHVKEWQRKLKDGDCFFRRCDGITIYGYVYKLDILEDANLCKQEHMRNFRFCKCYSKACPDGELGSVHICTIEGIISKKLFETCKALDFPSAYVTKEIHPDQLTLLFDPAELNLDICNRKKEKADET